MKNPLYTKGQILEYVIVGLIAAIGYFFLLWAHLIRASYESAYLLYIGNVVFGAVILIYNLVLIRRSYVNKRAVSRLMGFDAPGGSEFKIPVSDTQAYRQFGNSVVVPAAKAIATFIQPYLMDVMKIRQQNKQMTMDFETV